MSINKNIYRKRGTGTIRKGYLMVVDGGKQRPFHVVKVEKILGHPLPDKAVVHHIDGNRENNENSNLVVCNDHAHHMLLHRRQRSIDACGHVDWRKCPHCKQYDDPKNMNKNGISYRHLSCAAEYNRKRYVKVSACA